MRCLRKRERERGRIMRSFGQRLWCECECHSPLVVKLLHPIPYLCGQTLGQAERAPRVVIAAETIPQQTLLDAIFDDFVRTFHIEIGVKEFPIIFGLLLHFTALAARCALLSALQCTPSTEHRLREQSIHAICRPHRRSDAASEGESQEVSYPSPFWYWWWWEDTASSWQSSWTPAELPPCSLYAGCNWNRGKFAGSRQKENKFLALLAAHWQRQQQWRRHRPRHADTSTLLLLQLASTHHQSLEAPLLVFWASLWPSARVSPIINPRAAEAEAGALQLQHTIAATTWRRGCHRQSVWRWCWHMDAPQLFGQITWSRHDTRSLSSLWLLIGYFATPAAGRARGGSGHCAVCSQSWSTLIAFTTLDGSLFSAELI